MQDSKGFIWVGTDDGLVRFDGRDFKVYNVTNGMPNNYAISILEIARDEYLIGTWGQGVTRLKGETFLPTGFQGTTPHQCANMIRIEEKMYVWNSGVFWEGVPKNGNLFFKVHSLTHHAQKGYVFINRKKDTEGAYKSMTEPLVLSSIDNKIYFGRGKEGLWQLKADKSLQKVLTKPLAGEDVTVITKDYKGNRWIGAFGKLIRLDKNGEKKEFKGPSYRALKLFPLKDGRIVFITELHNQVEKGIYRLDPKTGNIEDLGKQLGIASSPSYAIEDHNGNLWFTTTGDGLFCVFNDKDNHITKDKKEPFYVNIVVEKDEDEMWVGTKSDLLTYNKNTNKLVNTKVDEPIWTMSRIDEKLFFHSPTTYTTDLKKTKISVRRIINIDDSTITGYHYYTIFKTYTDDTLRKGVPLYRFPQNVNIRDAKWRGDSLYVATKQGLFLLKQQTESDSLSLIREWKKSDGLLSNYVNALAWQGDTLWLATEGGVAFLFEGQIQGLASDMKSLKCEQLLVDHRGSLWFGTPKGLFCYDGKSMVAFNNQTGLVANDVTCIYEDRNKQLWVGSSVGVTVLDNSSIPSLVPAPNLYVSASDSTFLLDDKIKIDFHAINFETPSSTQYQYRLNKGDWRQTLNPYVEYNALKNGSYHFEVRARKMNSGWSTPVSVYFKVIPPWYLHWIAYVFYISAFVFSVILFAAWRIQRAVSQSRILRNEIDQRIRSEKRLAALRDQIAKDFHDEMGNKLASITVLSNLIKFKSDDSSKTISDLATKIEASSKDLYAGTKDFIWAIKARSDKPQELYDYLQSFGENFFNPMGIDFYISSKDSEPFDQYKLPLGWSRQLVLIFKEAMTNIGKYAQCKAVYLTFGIQHGRLGIILKDDGVGFEECVLPRINGLNNMRNRAETIGAELHITSDLADGTCVAFHGEIKEQ